jgi:hypothetical protein
MDYACLDGISLVLIGVLNPVQHLLAVEYTFTPIDVPFQGDPGARVNDINAAAKWSAAHRADRHSW